MTTSKELLDAMILDESKAPADYQTLSYALQNEQKNSDVSALIKILLDEHIADEKKHYDNLVKLRDVIE
jgi:hypothetical protein